MQFEILKCIYLRYLSPFKECNLLARKEV
jgi:hypothetical protein